MKVVIEKEVSNCKECPYYRFAGHSGMTCEYKGGYYIKTESDFIPSECPYLKDNKCNQ